MATEWRLQQGLCVVDLGGRRGEGEELNVSDSGGLNVLVGGGGGEKSRSSTGGCG